MLTRPDPALRSASPIICPARVTEFAKDLFGEILHAKRVASLADATLGVLRGTSLAVTAIGEGLALAKGLTSKHAIKQVDRLFSNCGVDVNELFDSWVPFVLAERTFVVVALDWTDFDADGHSTLALNLVTHHGRSTPLLWNTVHKSKLAKRRNAFEDALLQRLRRVIPQSVHVTILADRGFADQKLYEFLRNELHFDYIIRFRSCITVTNAQGRTQTAKQWVPKNHRVLKLRDASVTKDKYQVGAVVLTHDRLMKEAWCLATSRVDLSGQQVVALYGKRFTIEETFRDQKDLYFGLGLKKTHISDPKRRDRVLLVCAMSTVLLTLLGAAGEALGEDRKLKANTVKKRTHSLFRQGTYYYQALMTWPVERSALLLARFALLLAQHPFCQQVFGIV